MLGASGFVNAEEIRSQDYLVNVKVVAEGLSRPWSLAFLPDGNMLVTERTGNLRVIKNGKLEEKPVSGLPPIRQHGQGGLMDVVLHPAFESNRLIFYSRVCTFLPAYPVRKIVNPGFQNLYHT